MEGDETVPECRRHWWCARIKSMKTPTFKVQVKREETSRETEDGTRENTVRQTKECEVFKLKGNQQCYMLQGTT